MCENQFNKIQKAMGTRLGFVLTLLILYWLKTLLAYTVDFNLDIQLGQTARKLSCLYRLFQPPSFGTPPAGSSLYARSTKIFYGLSIAIL